MARLPAGRCLCRNGCWRVWGVGARGFNDSTALEAFNHAFTALEYYERHLRDVPTLARASDATCTSTKSLQRACLPRGEGRRRVWKGRWGTAAESAVLALTAQIFPHRRLQASRWLHRRQGRRRGRRRSSPAGTHQVVGLRFGSSITRYSRCRTLTPTAHWQSAKRSRRPSSPPSRRPTRPASLPPSE